MFVIRKAAPGTTVQPPKADAPVPALSKKAYAYGTRIAAAGDGVTIELGGNCLVKMGGGTVATVLNAGGTKMIVLDNGQVQATTPANNTDNLVSVRTLFGTRILGHLIVHFKERVCRKFLVDGDIQFLRSLLQNSSRLQHLRRDVLLESLGLSYLHASVHQNS